MHPTREKTLEWGRKKVCLESAVLNREVRRAYAKDLFRKFQNKVKKKYEKYPYLKEMAKKRKKEKEEENEKKRRRRRRRKGREEWRRRRRREREMAEVAVGMCGKEQSRKGTPMRSGEPELDSQEPAHGGKG